MEVYAMPLTRACFCLSVRNRQSPAWGLGHDDSFGRILTRWLRVAVYQILTDGDKCLTDFSRVKYLTETFKFVYGYILNYPY